MKDTFTPDVLSRNISSIVFRRSSYPCANIRFWNSLSKTYTAVPFSSAILYGSLSIASTSSCETSQFIDTTSPLW